MMVIKKPTFTYTYICREKKDRRWQKSKERIVEWRNRIYGDECKGHAVNTQATPCKEMWRRFVSSSVQKKRQKKDEEEYRRTKEGLWTSIDTYVHIIKPSEERENEGEKKANDDDDDDDEIEEEENFHQWFPFLNLVQMKRHP